MSVVLNRSEDTNEWGGNSSDNREHKLTIELHHVNVPTHNPERMVPFYKDVLGLVPFSVDRLSCSSRGTVFLGADVGEIHLGAPEPYLLATNEHSVNPILRGHSAFRTNDIDKIKANLEKLNVPYSDYGVWALKNWYQIYFYDPEGNVVEVQQIVE